MGVAFGYNYLNGSPFANNEIDVSLTQILFALQNGSPDMSHSRSHHSSPKSLTNENHVELDEMNSSKTHLESTRGAHVSVKSPRSTRINDISRTRRYWKCRFCDFENESDSQLCYRCGSNKINVYVPISNPIINNDKQILEARTSTSSSNHSSFTNENSRNNTHKSVHEERVYRRSVLISHKREADEHIVLKHIEKLKRKCELTNSRFKDENFPASFSSLFINGNSFSELTIALLPDQQQNPLNSEISPQNIIWLRPDQIKMTSSNEHNRTSWTVFRDPTPNDVFQGALGDCWFITALSVLAEMPEYLMKILITREYSPEGIYCVRLCKDGEWTQVFVDDRLPCTTGKRLAFSQAHRKQLWVPLIEKALAKLHGSYESIIAGRCCEGLATVTGSPCETLILGRSNNPDDKNVDHDKIWLKLLNARSQRFLMCAMCSNNFIPKEDFESRGLLNIHAYSLQDVKQSKDGKHRLVKLRNPWGGTYRWTGDWSDQSSMWSENPDLKHELLTAKQNQRDGVFWMPFRSFIKYFECVDICKLRNDWYEVRDTSNFYPSSTMIEAYQLNIRELTELDVSLYRKISKNLRSQRSEASLCFAIANIEQISNGNYRIYSIPIVSQRAQHKFVSANGTLKPGNYILLPLLIEPPGTQLDNTDFTVAIHSSRMIDLERCQLPKSIQREFLIKFCIFYGDIIPTDQNSTRRSSSTDHVKIYELKNYWDGLILLVENRHPSKNVHFHFRSTICDNAVISRGEFVRETFDIIPCSHRQIIVSITRKVASHSFTIGHDYEYQLSSRDTVIDSNGHQRRHWPNIDQSNYSEDIHRPQLLSSVTNTFQ